MLRAFGSKDRLYIQATGSTRTPGQSVEPAVGDVDGAIGQIYDDYERIGDRVIGMLAEEHRMPALTEAIEAGRTNHREWVAHACAPQLRPLRGAARRQAVLAVVAATDIYIWKLLRRDYGLAHAEADTVVRRLVAGAFGKLPAIRSRGDLDVANFVWACWDGGGNLTPSLGIAHELTARGHQVHSSAVRR